MEYSLISVAYKSARNIQTVIEQAKSATSPPLEIIVLVNHYETQVTNEILKYVESEPAITRWVYCSQNIGVATAWNLCMTIANTEHLVVINDDCQVGVETYERIVKGFIDPDVGIVGVAAGGEPSDARITAQGFLLAFRKSMISKIGGYSEASSPLADEHELGLRAWVNGYRTVIVEAPWEHVHDISNRPDTQIRYLGRIMVPNEFQKVRDSERRSSNAKHNFNLFSKDVGVKSSQILIVNFLVKEDPTLVESNLLPLRIIDCGRARGHEINIVSTTHGEIRDDASLTVVWDPVGLTGPGGLAVRDLAKLMIGRAVFAPTGCASISPELAHVWAGAACSTFLSQRQELYHLKTSRALFSDNHPRMVITPPLVGHERFFDKGHHRDIEVLVMASRIDAAAYHALNSSNVVVFGDGGLDIVRAFGRGSYVGTPLFRDLPDLFNRAQSFAHLPLNPEAFQAESMLAYLSGCRMTLNEHSDDLMGRSRLEIRESVELADNCTGWWDEFESLACRGGKEVGNDTPKSRQLLIGASMFDAGWGGIQIQTLNHIKNSRHNFVIYADKPGSMSQIFTCLPNVRELVYCDDSEVAEMALKDGVDVFLHHTVNHTERASLGSMWKQSVPTVVFHYCVWPPQYDPVYADILVTEAESNIPILRQNQDFMHKTIRTLDLSIDFSEFDGLESVGTIRARLGIAADKIVIGRFGRLEPIKRPEDFIVAAGYLKKLLPGKLVFVLGGRLSQSVEEQYLKALYSLIAAQGLEVGADIFLTGEMSERDKLGVINAMDIYLYPTEGEGYCMAFLEAMYLAKPVVTYDNCANKTTVGGGGVVVPYLDLRALIEETVNLVLDPAKRSELGRVGRALVLERNSAPDFAAKLDAWCEEALASKHFEHAKPGVKQDMITQLFV